jgi:hypothetical protein
VFRVPSLTAVLIIAAAAVTSACGQQHAGGSGSGGPGSVSSGSPPAVTAGSCHGSAAVMTGHTVTVDASDNGKSFCVKPGTGILVVLRGSPARKWTPIHVSSSVLAPRPNGRLQLDVTSAYFVAVRSGTAVITSARPVCASHPSSGSLSCDSELAFHATVKVHG